MGFRVAARLLAVCSATPEVARFGGRYATAGAGSHTVGVLCPETFMNRSGSSVRDALDALALEASALLVVVDDLDLPFGRLRLRPSGGAGGHRGLADVIDALEPRDVARLRFGVGRPAEDQDPVEYVLAPFSQPEEDALPAHLDAAIAAIEIALRDGVERAMNVVNAPPAELTPS